MNQPGFFEDCEGIKKLCSEYFNQLRAEATERVLFDEFIKIG